MSDIKRPRNYDDMVESRASEADSNPDGPDTVYEAWQSGALWAALVFEGRIDPEDELL